MFRSLRIRNYRYYAAGSAVSNIGTWLQRVAQDWLVLQLAAGSGTALGITTGLQFLPFLLIAPFGGLIADRFPKRRVLQCTQVAMGLTAGALAVLDLTGVVQVWHVYLLAFLFGVAGAIDNPARQSFVVEMVGKDDLANAVGLNSASFNGARVIGPAIAGLMIMLVGTGWVILANALTYGATIWALTKMRRSELHTPTPVPRKPGMLMDAVLYVRSRPDLIMVLTVVFFVGCFGLNFQLTSALMATHVFGKGAGGYGILGSVMAVGAVAGALAAARRGSPRLRLVLGAAVGFGVLEIASGLMPTYASFALSLPLLGFAQLTMITAANAMMQLSVVPEMRGRVIALYSMVFIGSTPIGSPIVGWVGESFGARWTLIGGGLVSALGAAVAAAIVLRRENLVVRAHVRPRPHLHVWSAADLAAADGANGHTPAVANGVAAGSASSDDLAIATARLPRAARTAEGDPIMVTGAAVAGTAEPGGPAAVGASVDPHPRRVHGRHGDALVEPRSVHRSIVPAPMRTHDGAGSAGGRIGLPHQVDSSTPRLAAAEHAASVAVSAADEKVPACNPPDSSPCSKPTVHEFSRWRRRVSTRRFRPVRAGQSKMS